jgi:hypothetical protein
MIMLLALLGGNLFSPGQWHKDFRIGLGLDLSSGTVLSMKATTLSGGTPSASDLNEAKSIILSRVNASGNTGAQVQTQGNDILNVSVPGKTSEQTERLVSETAVLNFRQTLPTSRTRTSSSSSAPRVAAPPWPAPALGQRAHGEGIVGLGHRHPKGQRHRLAQGIGVRQPELERDVHQRHHPRRRQPGQRPGDRGAVQQGAVHAGRHD